MRKTTITILVLIIVSVILLIFSQLFFFTGENPDGITEKAIDSKDVSACDALTNRDRGDGVLLRAGCYLKYALAYKDENVCKILKEQLGTYGRSIRIDKSVQISSTPISCFVGVAYLKEDPQICENLKIIFKEYFSKDYVTESEKTFNGCYQALANKLQDKSLCENLEGDAKLWCLIPFSERSICEQFSSRGGFCHERFDSKEKGYGMGFFLNIIIF